MALEIAVPMYRVAGCLAVRQLYQHLRLQRRRFASSAQSNPLAKAQASISRLVALYFILHPSHHIVFPFNEPKLELVAAWSRNRRRWPREA